VVSRGVKRINRSRTTDLDLLVVAEKAVVGFRPSFSSHVRFGERGAPVDSLRRGCDTDSSGTTFQEMQVQMADLNAAIDYVLGWEDATLSGAITTAPDGKRTRFGIDEHWHPELTNCLFYSSMGQVAALQIARGIYDLSYCQPLCIAEIANQDIANKLLSLGVNVGVVNAARMLQDAVTVVGDGRIGPLTLHALDLSDPEKVLADLRTEAENYYDELVKANPSLEVYRAGWLRRAAA
jgi:hypothetical protein